MIESYITKRLQEKKILLMTHIVLGYPSLSASASIVEEMVKAGVDLMELQIPFSEPIADGPVILAANQKALERGAKVEACLSFARKVTAQYDIPFLFMTYYNILFKYGVAAFARQMAQTKIAGAIIPDLPPEEAKDYLGAMDRHGLDPIFIYSPTTSSDRLAYLSTFARGFVYCVARKGVTGEETAFSDTLTGYLARCRKATRLPLAVGFGIKSRQDVEFLTGKAEVAVIGSETLRIIDEQGVGAVGAFIRGLRQ